MKNILFIAPEFPPINLPGSHRALKFIKHLSDFKINPIVITGDFLGEYDKSMLDEIPNKIKIIRLKTKSINKKHNPYINLNDTYHKMWKVDLKKHINEIIDKYKPTLIYLTCPPYSTTKYISQVSKSYNIPLLLDLRDAWSQWFLAPYPTIFHYYIIKKREKSLFKNACAIIFPTDQLIINYKKLYPSIADKFSLISNSIDENIIAETDDTKNIKSNTQKNVISIGYVGSFYYNPYSQKLINDKWYNKKIYQWFHYLPSKEDWTYRSPYYFFNSMRAFLDKYPKFENRIIIELIGVKPFWLDPMIEDFNLKKQVKHYGFKSKNESISFQKNCDYLLSTSVKVENGQDYCIASKTIEYIGLKKPVISFVTEGAQQRFLKDSGLGIIFNPDNTDENINLFYNLFSKKILPTYNQNFIDDYSTKYTSQQLAALIFKHALD